MLGWMSEREFDLVVFGATGVTGRRAAAYLCERADELGRAWAAAGRDPGKVRRILAEDGHAAPAVIAADVEDGRSLRRMAASAKTVVNLVGPYSRYGEAVIEACVGARTHYVDASGEIPFVRRMIDRFDAPSREAGIKIVQVSGFESLPADVGVALAAQAARDRWDEPLAAAELKLSVSEFPPGRPRVSDMLSGGTLQSMVEGTRDPDASGLTDPGHLIESRDDARAVRARSPIRLRVHRGADGVLAPMLPFAFINPAVVHRSAAMLAAERGEVFEPFSYREAALIGSGGSVGPLHYAAAAALVGVQAMIAATSRRGPAFRAAASRAMARVFPGSGYGPAADRLGWVWRLEISARASGGARVTVNVDGVGHPGYLATSRIIGEAGLLLAEEGATPRRHGCLTPALALGTSAVARFERAGLSFSVTEGGEAHRAVGSAAVVAS